MCMLMTRITFVYMAKGRLHEREQQAGQYTEMVDAMHCCLRLYRDSTAHLATLLRDGIFGKRFTRAHPMSRENWRGLDSGQGATGAHRTLLPFCWSRQCHTDKDRTWAPPNSSASYLLSRDWRFFTAVVFHLIASSVRLGSDKSRTVNPDGTVTFEMPFTTFRTADQAPWTGR